MRCSAWNCRGDRCNPQASPPSSRTGPVAPEGGSRMPPVMARTALLSAFILKKNLLAGHPSGTFGLYWKGHLRNGKPCFTMLGPRFYVHLVHTTSQQGRQPALLSSIEPSSSLLRQFLHLPLPPCRADSRGMKLRRKGNCMQMQASPPSNAARVRDNGARTNATKQRRRRWRRQ